MELFSIWPLQRRVNLACKPRGFSNVYSAGNCSSYHESKGKVRTRQDDAKDSDNCLGDCSAGASPKNTAELVSGCSMPAL